MKKKIIIILAIIVSLILLVPVPTYYKDGGTVSYRAILYSATKYHSIDLDMSYYCGWEIKILGLTVYENTYTSDE